MSAAAALHRADDRDQHFAHTQYRVIDGSQRHIDPQIARSVVLNNLNGNNLVLEY
jgi:hypothetical protein